MTKKRIFHFFLLSAFSFMLSVSLYSQDTAKTSVKAVSPAAEKKKIAVHSPRKAMIFSAVVPGLGQAYNKKYWKMPIVWGTMGTTIYLFNVNNKIYKDYKQAYVYRTDTLASTVDAYPDYTADDLRTLSGVYRRYRDLNVILTGVFYVLNIADAYVDAQLTTFDISDNLSMTVLPNMNLSSQRKNTSMGLTLSFTF